MNQFKVLNEDQLDQIINHKECLVESKGQYGLDCLLYQGDLTIEIEDDKRGWLDDKSIDDIIKDFPNHEIGTIAIQGNLIVKGNIDIDSWLHLLFVSGNLTAENFKTVATEVYVGGNFKVSNYSDHDGYLKVKGENFGTQKNIYGTN